MPETTAVKSDQVLALDVATKTGWATKVSGGTWDFSPKKDESAGMRLIRFRSKLMEMLDTHGIKLVIFERSAGVYKSSIIVQSELHGVMKTACEDRKIEYRGYSASEIKKFATGKGNCGKPEMIAAARQKYGIEPFDDNHADALHILHLALTDLGLNEKAF